MKIWEIENTFTKILLIAGILISGIIITSYLAGYFLLVKFHLNPLSATPFTILDYWQHDSDNPYIRRWISICSFAAAIPSIMLIFLLLVPTKRAMHGDARFAKKQEIKEAGLLGDKGIILGKLGNKYLILPGQQGVMCAAPPRSGKGAGLVQPNMVNFPDSIVILDIRQESFRITSGYRQQFSEVYLFNPVAEDRKTMQWNPLHYVSDDPVLRINDLQKIANMLSPDPASGDPFWPSSSRSLFLGLALYVFETPHLPRTFGEIVRQIMHGENETVGDHWKKIIGARGKSDNPLSEICKSALYDFINTSPATQSSIRKTFTAKLELWLNPLVDAATCADSFDLRDLRKKRISLYVGIRPADLDRLQLIINLLFQQIIDLNTKEMPEDNPSLKYQCLLLMDEFTAVGRMPIFATAIGFLGGYNLRPFIIIQSPSQLHAVYGKEIADTIITCCAATIVYAPKEQRHASEISEMLGFQTIAAQSTSKQFGIHRTGGSINSSNQRRALLLPQEVKEIGKHKEIIFLENLKPILCKKIRYWTDNAFIKRVNLPQANIIQLPEIILNKTAILSIEPQDKADTHNTINTLDMLDLQDFDIDFEEIIIPPADQITDEVMQDVFNDFLANIRD